MGRILVAGLGNTYMGDDGFGPAVIERLQRRELPENVEVRDVGTCGVTLAPDLDEYELVIFVDAVHRGGKVGTIYRSEIKAEEVKELESGDPMRSLTFSLHGTGLEEILSYAKTVGTIPPRAIVFGCEIAEIALGDGLSAAVEVAVPTVVERILDELQWYGERE